MLNTQKDELKKGLGSDNHYNILFISLLDLTNLNIDINLFAIYFIMININCKILCSCIFSCDFL